MSRARTGQVIPITAALGVIRDDGHMLDFESITDAERAAWRQRRDAEDDRERRRSERVVALDARRRGLIAAGFPLRAVEESLAADESGASIAFMRAWDPTERCIVVLSGPNGVGKTVAATWWALRAPVAPMFVRASTYARAPRYGGEEATTKAKWLGASALVFDDAGAEFLDEKGSLQVDLDELVDTFYGDRRTLVITSNLPSEGTKRAPGFFERYGARLRDRIREGGLFFEDDGPSRRGAP